MAALYRPFVSGEASSAATLIAPADCPLIVMRFGSPPNARMFFFTQRSAAIWSSRP